uniref:WD repeat-containing protein 63 n=1 Tax=Pyramimonas obovata TaxID=1411642 RepID=A0A7S0R4E4_9CHLO|mmetsp:Transcript_25495/g.55414  ORF Transcript_25495/g.55414 Transcript_25495/m.55414 type:complete len:809 (+) Transcript_25495:51-2477(+)
MAEEPVAEGGEGGPMVPEPGVESIFLTGTTLKLVGIEDMGKNLLMKHVETATLLHDIQFRGAISDFHPIKTKIQKCDYDPILVRYNEDDIYGDQNNFEIVLLKETADKWLAAEEEAKRRAAEEEAARLAAEEEAKANKGKKKRRPPAPWVSLGSELEIEECKARPTREPLVVSISRKRREFGLAFKLSDKDAQELWNSSQMECRPYRDSNFELRRMEHDLAIQAIPAQVDKSVQATNGMSRTGATQYESRYMEEEVAEDILQSKPLNEFLGTITERYENALQQNEVMDIFEDEYASLAEEDSAPGEKGANLITPYQSFTDLTYSKGKRVSAIVWVPKKKGMVAVACTEPKTFDERLENAGRVQNSAILIWSFSDPIHPQYVLDSPFDVFSFQFNPKRPEIVCGGLYNGQIIFWNTQSLATMKKKKDGDDSGESIIPKVKFSLLSAVENSHTGPVTDLMWLPEGIEVQKFTGNIHKPGNQDCNMFVTLSRDGRVMFWDIRVKKDPKKGEIVWVPTYSITLSRVEVAGDLSAVKFAFSFENGFSQFFWATSMDGEVVQADFIKPPDVDHPEYTKSVSAHHFGPVLAIQRSPFFSDILLTVGEWTFRIWKEGIQAPIFVSHCADFTLATGCWSPTRPGLIYTAKTDGNLEVWDLLDRSHEASMVATISSSSIQSIQFWPVSQNQQLLAVGDGQGVLHIMEMPRNLRRPVANEKEIMTKFFDREVARCNYTEERRVFHAAEKKEKGAAELAAKAEEGKAEKGKKGEDQLWDAKAEQEYHELERAFKIQLGLISEDDPDEGPLQPPGKRTNKE